MERKTVSKGILEKKIIVENFSDININGLQ